MGIHMKIGDKVVRDGNQYKDWVGQIVQLEDNIALVKWDTKYPSPGLWESQSVLKVVEDSSVVGKQ